MAECTKIAKVIEGCKEKTYGVRDEYRVSGHAARIILENVEEKAREYLKSDPVLWIPSKIWFKLLRRRVREIQRTQISIIKKNPPNLGILTGVLNHMLHSTTSTPKIYDSHVLKSLALLEYRNILETAGMFFLQDFNINSDTCLAEVQQIDDVHVLALIGVNAKAQRDRAVSRRDAWQSTRSELEDYPLGRTMKLIKGKHIFVADLMDSQPFDTDGNLRRKTERQKWWELQKKMTMAKKNKRVPPPPRPRRPFPMTQLEDIVE
ncbi:hypothetical protein EDB19DRAFT_1914718 [Suillus lakei]|nr:hypothetical protein EDB19DRAFT_1914718 [Suillus lakei]